MFLTDQGKFSIINPKPTEPIDSIKGTPIQI